MSANSDVADSDVASRLLAWFDIHGRTDLPWQQDPRPYRVWVSEIMLQQTQVRAVIGYFERFTARFPDLASLAAADVDEVLHLWSGLGYYARARNLHEAARRVCEHHHGALPADIDALQSLPGIGRSTAGAILSLSLDQPHAILDGNVKRVLCRYHAIEEWPGGGPVLRRLWTLAEGHTPRQRSGAYSQAIMDLGATLCTKKRPGCTHCPLSADCRALATNRVHDLPTPRPRAELPRRETVFLILREPRGSVRLERRPPSGIWGGLWGFPECTPDADIGCWCRQHLGVVPDRVQMLTTLHHGFTHYRLDIHPALIDLPTLEGGSRVAEAENVIWYHPGPGPGIRSRIGLPAPVTTLLSRLSGLSGCFGLHTDFER